jgi:hypothetical protein
VVALHVERFIASQHCGRSGNHGHGSGGRGAAGSPQTPILAPARPTSRESARPHRVGWAVGYPASVAPSRLFARTSVRNQRCHVTRGLTPCPPRCRPRRRPRQLASRRPASAHGSPQAIEVRPSMPSVRPADVHVQLDIRRCCGVCRGGERSRPFSSRPAPGRPGPDAQMTIGSHRRRALGVLPHAFRGGRSAPRLARRDRNFSRSPGYYTKA